MRRKTLLMEALEAGLNGISLSVYLHTHMAAGWTLGRIAEDLEERTDIFVDPSTLSRWTNELGYAKRLAAQVAWNNKLILQAALRRSSAEAGEDY